MPRVNSIKTMQMKITSMANYIYFLEKLSLFEENPHKWLLIKNDFTYNSIVFDVQSFK